jgi:tetratricopeptide (TPR) repeat protein
MLDALAKQPENAHWLVQIGEVYQFSLSPKHPDAPRAQAKAQAYFARAAALGTDATPFAAVGKAMVMAEAGQADEARALLEQTAARAPHLWEVWHALGYVQLHLQPVQAEAAEAAFRRALAMEPDDVRTVRGVAAAILAQGRYEDALELARRAAELSDPSLALDLVNLGHALFQLQRYEEALAVLDQALEREPGHVKALLTQASALNSLGRSEEALALLNDAIARDDGSEHAVLYENRGSTYMTLARPADALPDYEEALSLRPEEAQSWANRAFARMQLSQLDGAREDLSKALELDPKLPEAWANLAGVLEAQGDRAAAEAALTQGIEHAPQAGQLWLFRGQYRQMRGDEKAAIEDYERALEAGGSAGAPLPPESVIMLCRAYRRTEQPAKVLALLEARGADLPERLHRHRQLEGAVAHFGVAAELAEAESFVEALPHVQKAWEGYPETRTAMLGARIEAHLGHADPAFAWLDELVTLGWKDADLLTSDPELIKLREDPRYDALVARLRGGG